MESIKVGISLSDKDFARALARGLAGECRKMSFYQMNSTKNTIGVDLILTDKNSCGSHIVQLVDDPDDEEFQEGCRFRIFKYRESSDFVRTLLLAHYQYSGKILRYKEHRQTRLIAAVSAAGGSGTTSVSLAACRSLRRLYGKRCLYLNLSPVNDAGKYLNMSSGQHLLKLLYALSEEKDFPPEAFVTKGEDFDYISTGILNTYSEEMNPEILQRFLKRMEESGVYDILLVDIGNILSRRNKELLAFADLVLFIWREDYRLPGKYLEEITREIEKSAEYAKVIPVINCCDSSWEENDGGQEIRISYDTDAFAEEEDGKCRILLTRNYGTEISVIAKKITEEEGELNSGRNSEDNIERYFSQTS